VQPSPPSVSRTFLSSQTETLPIKQLASPLPLQPPFYFVFYEFDDPAAAAAAKSLQSCPTPCNPIDGSSTGSPIPGFSRQEHWSGLPFPSPMHESEK